MKFFGPTLLASVALLCAPMLRAGDLTESSTSSAAFSPDTRYGLFGLLDHRSQYGQGVYPEPFLVDDSDEETDEFRVDWFRTAIDSSHTDVETTEVEKGFGVVTLEVEVPIEIDSVPGSTISAFDNVDVGARAPFFQWVSPGGQIDTTTGAAVEVGIPTHSTLSKNMEFVPKIFDDLKIGDFTMQAIVGYSMLYGPGDEGGTDTFEYGFDFGYTISHKVLPIPGVQQVIPVFELSGEKGLNKGLSAVDSLEGNAAIRFNLNAIGPVQPRLGIGFVFPISNAAHDDMHWGLYTSLVFEY